MFAKKSTGSKQKDFLRGAQSVPGHHVTVNGNAVLHLLGGPCLASPRRLKATPRVEVMEHNEAKRAFASLANFFPAVGKFVTLFKDGESVSPFSQSQRGLFLFIHCCSPRIMHTRNLVIRTSARLFHSVCILLRFFSVKKICILALLEFRSLFKI